MARKNDWTRLRDLFDRAANLDAAGRARLLDRECRDDPDLRREVERMLASHDAAGRFLAAPTEPLAGPPATPSGARTLTPDATNPAPGTTIGPYKLLQQIGEGGFGVVYMAEQQEPIVRKVALKVIKLGMDTRQVIARFEAERQALALMDHPNIARIFDAGATEAGRPYFVMELVHGIPITEYCDRERLTTRQRLELFIQVCQAVGHAHQKGVIHRDLKPSNVLVTLHDGTPVPKVIDFGIARAIHQRLTERTLFTEYGQLIGTPEYMSPEQAEMSGLDIDTRSDIYSLGALLYELLSGEKLFEPRRLRSLALGEIQRVIREEEPPRPSARVSSLGVTATEVAQCRGVQAPQLIRLLRGDPDWIVVKAIAKDRRRRYDSAGALAADIERYMRSEPVSASPPGIPYRASRFIRRHRVGAFVALALAISMMLGTAVATVGLVRARRAERVARQEARRNALDADAMRAFLTRDDPTYVARVEEVIALERATVPMDTLALGNYLVNTYGLLSGMESLGLPQPPALDSLIARLGAEAIDVLISVESPRGSILETLGLIRDEAEKKYPERLPDVLRRLLILRQRAGEPDSALATDRLKLARLLREMGGRELLAGRPGGARPLLTEAFDHFRRTGRRLDVAGTAGDLGACLMDLGQYAAAESLLLESYRVSGAREQLMRLVSLYERTGRSEVARSYDARTRVASVRELGTLPGVPSTMGRGRGFSARLGDRWIWVFSATRITRPVLPPQSNVLWNSWSWTRDRDARDGIDLHHELDSRGVPPELLTMTPGEGVRDDSAGFTPWLEPLGFVEDPTRKRVLILYTKIITRFQRAGTSFAVWTAGAPVPRRVVVRPGSPEPTLLFQGGEPDFSGATVVVRDTLYLYGARGSVGFQPQTVLGRAPLATVLERGAWRFYASSGRWSPDVRDAVVITNGAGSVHWNEHLRKFVVTTVNAFSELIEMRTSDRPEGPWSASEVIHTTLGSRSSPGWGGGHAIHPELARERGRIQYLTYERPMGFFDGEGRLIEVVFK